MRSALAPLALLLVAGFLTGCGGEDETTGPTTSTSTGTGTSTSGGNTADVAPFEGIPWVLTSGIDVEGWEKSAPSATFEKGRVTGSSGCNQYSGTYTIDGESIEIDPGATTLIGCEGPLAKVESEYRAKLGSVAGWRIEKGELVLVDDAGGELLRYEAATPLGHWSAFLYRTADAVQSLILGTTITATFTDDGRLVGSAGCNDYRATYTGSEGRIEISPPASTKKTCPTPEGVMAQEATYLATLPTATRYRIGGGSLELLRPDGTIVAKYERAKIP